VTIAILPHGTAPDALAGVEGLAPGLLSAGIGKVPSDQTYLDITQGNRVSESLYDGGLPHLRLTPAGVAPAGWDQVLDRASSAPADIVPGLLASSLAAGGVPIRADPEIGSAALLAADGDGRIARVESGRCPPRGCPGVTVVDSDVDGLNGLVSRLRGDDLLIAVERPPPGFRVLTFAVAGRGLSGLVTSDSTRTDGLVAANDVAPTILERYVIDVPDEMNGEPIEAKGEADLGEVTSLQQRLRITGERRGPVIGENLLIWVVLSALAALAFGRRGARVALALLALSVAYLPLVLLGTAALEPSLTAERLIAGIGSPLLAAVTLALVGGWAAFAIACLASVVGYGIDVIAGSALTPLSLPGPNPASGSRFFGIGNEVEAVVAALVPIGVGAALAARPSTRDGGTVAAVAFLAAGILAAAVFAIGRFGADVGAAIVLPAGAAVAAAVALGSRRALALVLVVPFACLAALVAADVALGGGAHLTRSVLDAGGFDQAGDVVERRVRLAADSFTRTPNLPFLALTLIAIALGVYHRDRVLGWFRERSALAGVLGAAGATVIGTFTNDSGVVLLILGTTYIVAAVGFAWSRLAR
jgi:hypothetical protein